MKITTNKFMTRVLLFCIISFTIPYLVVNHWLMWPLILSVNGIFSLLIVYRSQVREYFQSHYNIQFSHGRESRLEDMWRANNNFSMGLVAAALLARGIEIYFTHVKEEFSNGLNISFLEFEYNIITFDVMLYLQMANVFLAAFEWYVGTLANAKEQLEEVKNDLQINANDLQTEINRLQKLTNDLQTNNDGLQTEKTHLQTLLDGLQTEKDNLQMTLENLQNSDNLTKTECDKLAEELEETRNLVKDYENEIASAEKDIKIAQYMKDFGVFYKGGSPHIVSEESEVIKGSPRSKKLQDNEGNILWTK